MTLPLIYLLMHGDSDACSVIKDAIDNPKQADIAKVVSLVNAGPALDYCKQLAHTYVAKAHAELTGFSDNIYKQALITLADLSVERIK